VTASEPVVINWQVTNPGCETKEATVTIFPFEITEADIPNVITPNGDGTNETWQVLRDKPPTASVRIINRWGRIVFEASPYTNNWSASDLSEGVYFYRLTVSGCNTEFKGSLQVIR
jgi:gliding motility-associated-like protein